MAFFCYLIHGFNSFMSRGCGELIRGLQNLEKLSERKVYKGGFAAARWRKAAKGFHWLCVKLLFGWADSRFGKPRNFPVRERFYSFRLYEKNQKYPKGLRPSGLPGTIQSSAGDSFGDTSDGTSRNRFFAQNGGEKALNRCEVRALQREDLGRTTKEWPCFLWTVGYGWVRMGDGGQKRVALEGNMEGVVRIKRFWRKKGRLLRIAQTGLFKWKVFGL